MDPALEHPNVTLQKKYGPFDLIFEATGASSVVFESMQALGKNGVLVLSSVTGRDRKMEIPADRINLEFVLGNKVMVGTVNVNRHTLVSVGEIRPGAAGLNQHLRCVR